MEYKFTGIILAKYNVGEADRIYTVFTLENGKMKVLAKGVRKSQARLAGNLENFNLVDLGVARSKGTGKITSSIIENNFKNLRTNLAAMKSAFSGAEILDKMTGLEEKDKNIFNLLKEYLETLDSAAVSQEEKIALIEQGFILKLLEHLGYKIEVSRCVNCSLKLSQSGNYFSAEKGGAACSSCQKEIRDGLKISTNAIKIIRIIFTNKLKSLLKLKAGEEEIRNLRLVNRDFVRWIAK